jgi:hypothetical protein
LLFEIISHGSLRIESEDSLCDFIRKAVPSLVEEREDKGPTGQ